VLGVLVGFGSWCIDFVDSLILFLVWFGVVGFVASVCLLWGLWGLLFYLDYFGGVLLYL